MKKIDSYSFNNNGDTMYIHVYKDGKDLGLAATISNCGKMKSKAKRKLAEEVLEQLDYDLSEITNAI